MRTITSSQIRRAVSGLCIRANCVLRSDVLKKLKHAFAAEKNPRSKKALGLILENARCARRHNLAICQDTGMPVVFIELGHGVRIKGDLKQAVLNGVQEGYCRGDFRASIVRDPLDRSGSGHRGALMHIDTARGDKLKITLLPKGFGCENKSRLKMFLPTASLKEIKSFILDTVKSAGADACPPYVVGVGIGGAADYASVLAKKALLRGLFIRPSQLEKELEDEINRFRIGPMGFGGRHTCLGVHVKTYPTHIAGFPVAVNISCHALRSASVTL
jgi:fumarate hydratase subunit alpha